MRRGRKRGERGKCLDFAGHRGVELEEEAGDLRVGPAVSGDHAGHVEQCGGQGVAGHLVAGERVVFVRAVDDGDDAAGEQLGVAQRIGEPVRSERVFEVACVADEGPAWSP